MSSDNDGMVTADTELSLVIDTLKVTGPPGSGTDSGLAVFTTSIEACRVFPKVQVTLSPSASPMVAVRPDVDVLLVGSLQLSDDNVQPGVAHSVTVYVVKAMMPPATQMLLAQPSSTSEKAVGIEPPVAVNPKVVGPS